MTNAAPTQARRHKSPMLKPWYKSTAINGALGAGLSALLSPAVAGLLPQNWATGLAVVSTVASAIGLRRALP